MKFIHTDLKGSYIIEIDPIEDSRGSFARLWCKEEFLEHGININILQANLSHNIAVGTLRGMHFQWAPSQEGKLIRCNRGRIYDVIVDLRPDSPTFTHHIAVELDSQTHNTIYVPPGFAHGFQTLEANSDIVYMMSDNFQPELADGVRYNDPQFKIEWPLSISSIAHRDRNYPDFNTRTYSERYLQALRSIHSDKDNSSQNHNRGKSQK